ncbi:hypothetical protein B0H16DRAFT_1746335 [Mycena metata]|uniref:Ricin B lectin domain-containing protein n=1 Tax=Mycena metata TaxID=1033252 RepID=A0AAD7MAA7_9AGAR|nr:hypothetical protein B0H16DRAFT_1746335 [Mycena metata]
MIRALLAASLATLASAQILAPVNGNNYTIYNAHNNRCANMIGSDTNDYVPVIMAACNGLTNQLWTAHVNPIDATFVSFSSVAVPGSWLSYSTAEIAGGPDSMHQHTIVHFTPYQWYIGRSSTISASNSSASGVLTSYVPRAALNGAGASSQVSLVILSAQSSENLGY